MHNAAYTFIVKHLITIGVDGKRILEIGSLDVNASEQGLSLRALCSDAAAYVGIDLSDGPGVDAVCAAADYDGKARFDLVISTEAMEHTPAPESIIACAWRALAPGGVLLLTAAAPERAAHNCDGTGYAGVEHYANIAPDQLRAWLADWEGVQITYVASLGDVYARATKPKGKQR